MGPRDGSCFQKRMYCHTGRIGKTTAGPGRYAKWLKISSLQHESRYKTFAHPLRPVPNNTYLSPSSYTLSAAHKPETLLCNVVRALCSSHPAQSLAQAGLNPAPQSPHTTLVIMTTTTTRTSEIVVSLLNFCIAISDANVAEIPMGKWVLGLASTHL